MPTTPPTITALPTPPNRTDPTTFSARADAWVAAVPTFSNQIAAVGTNAFNNATEAQQSATSAASSASAASGSATAAATSASAAATSATTAVNAPGTSGTSTTSLTIGTGSQTFTTQGSKAWVVGQFVTVASTASPTNFMHGQITAYNSGTGSMTVNVLAVGGSGTLASWTIGLVGPNATLTDQNSLQPVALTLPSIRPSLLLDFANSKKLDPRITFSRATSGTYYDGVTSAKAEENLLLRSQDFSATWTLATLTAGSAVTAPDATATGSSFTASAANGTLTQSVTAIAGDHTFSVWLRRVSGTGNIDITAHSGGTWVTQTITSSWARYTVTQTLTAGARTPGIRIVTSGDQIEVWGAQLEQRSAATAYTPTTTQPITNYIPQLLTAPAGVPRFDHNPTTGESLGLLVEEQRTNLIFPSADFASGKWASVGALYNATLQSNVAIAPDGTATADYVKASGAGLAYIYYYSNSATLGQSYVFSVFIKATALINVSITVDVAWGQGGASFSLVGAGSITSGANATIQAVGNGWYKVSSAVTLTQARADSGILFTATSDQSGFFIWGAQLEAGASPTSYIPTTSASVTRTADAASMTGVNFSSWYRQDQGTLYSESMTYQVAGAYTPASINDSGVDNTSTKEMLFTQYYLSAVNSIARRNNVEVARINSAAVVSGIFNKTAFAFAENSFATSTNGASASIDTSGSMPQSVNVLNIGAQMSNRNQTLNGAIRKIAYYPARLTNAQLQALTA